MEEADPCVGHRPCVPTKCRICPQQGERKRRATGSSVHFAAVSAWNTTLGLLALVGLCLYYHLGMEESSHHSPDGLLISGTPSIPYSPSAPSLPALPAFDIGQDTSGLASPRETEVELPTDPPTTGELPVWDQFTSCLQDSLTTSDADLLAYTVAAMLSETLLDVTNTMSIPDTDQRVPLPLFPYAPPAAMSSESLESPQPLSAHPKKFVKVSLSTLILISSEVTIRRRA